MVKSMSLKTKIKRLLGLNINKRVCDAVVRSGLFDETFYLAIYGVCSPYKSALEHYLTEGADKFYDPNPHFSTAYYIYSNLDVRNSNTNPLFHYISFGENEGRQPNPYFSPTIYKLLNPDVLPLQGTLLFHYVKHGRAANRPYCDFRSESNLGCAQTYQQWLNNNESESIACVAKDINSFEYKPIISIIVPVYNPDKVWLVKCIESVVNQTYQNWQLCLSDDHSTQPHVRQVLDEYTVKDKRINAVFRSENGHISAASNSALEIADGEWIALLDHDDELHQHALYHAVKVMNDKPNTQLIYTDEDKIDQDGLRSGPHFKTDWNLDLLYSQNYVSHLGIYKANLLKNIGGFRLGYEGSQDYDLLLRYSREIDHAKIVHIPKVLYHWRMVEGSTAMASEQKSYTTEAGIKALKDHFTVLNKGVIVEKGKHENIYKVNWQIQDEPFVSLIIPTYNAYEITKQAIDSILNKSTYSNFEILLVDNNSDEPTALNYFKDIDKHDKVTVLRYPHPFNYSAINNFAVEKAKGEIIGLINNDIEVISPEWLTEMVSHAQREDIGCVGAMLYFGNETVQHAGIILGIGGVAGHSHKYFKRDVPGYFSRLKIVQNLSAVTGACLLVRKAVFNKVNGLNEDDLAIAFNDVDFCLKVNSAGYRNLWTPYAELYHYESISRGAEDDPEKIFRFNNEASYMKDTWKTNRKSDPFYNSNLTLIREDFSIGNK